MRFAIGAVALLGWRGVLAAEGVGQFALQKILRDGRDVLGDVNVTSWSSWSSSSGSTNPRADWMARFPDSVPLAHLNIPGTHDAATWNYSQATQDSLAGATRCDGTEAGRARVYRCQRVGLLEALDAGIRFFDLRFALDPLEARLVFWHGPALLSAAADLPAVLFGVFAWLDAHPSETVLLSLQYERGTRAGAHSDAHVQRLLFDTLTAPWAAAYLSQTKNALGTLGEVRGKAVLLRRFDLDKLPPACEAALPGLHLSPGKWADNSRAFELVYNPADGAAAFIEDYYYPAGHDSVEGNVRAKFEAVAAHLAKAASGGFESLFVTFSSGTHVDALPPVYPEVMALGTGDRDEDGDEKGKRKGKGKGKGWKGKKKGIAGVNARLLELLLVLRGRRLGVVVMDFFEEPGDLVGALLGI
ncbi:PLC-like phosphodiesterase [Xylaria intraflava]|nr:PLC-like phosphodiesterase [Xylaria intraflava]